MLSHHLIREARRRAGLTQSELAERAHTTQSAVARWEAGRSLPSLEKLCELVECCGLEIGVSLTPAHGAEAQLLRERRSLSPEARLQRLLAAIPYMGGEVASDATGATDAPDAFEPIAILAALERYGVRYVLVGGLAATLHGAPNLTQDVDVAPERSEANLGRLALALSDVGAIARGSGDPRAWTPDLSADGLARATVHRLETRHGRLDLLFEPTGTSGYDDLRQQAVAVRVGEVAVTVASLGDVIRSKEAAGRSDDRIVVPLLRRLQRMAALEGPRRRTPRDSSALDA